MEERDGGSEDYDKWMEEWEKMDKDMSDNFEKFMQEMMKEESSETRKKREDDIDPMGEFMEEMETNMDKDFANFMKELEDNMAQGTRRERSIPTVVKDQTTLITSTGRTDYNGGEKVDTFDDFVLSVDKEMSADFEQFLRELPAEGNNFKRDVSKDNELFAAWKQNEEGKAHQKYELYRNEGRRGSLARNAREAETRKGFPDIASFFPTDTRSPKEEKAACSGY